MRQALSGENAETKLAHQRLNCFETTIYASEYFHDHAWLCRVLRNGDSVEIGK